jgi:hypothetical protein
MGLRIRPQRRVMVTTSAQKLLEDAKDLAP